MDISFKMLSTNEYVGLSVIKITSVPHISIINNSVTEEYIVNKYKNDFNRLLNEIHQLVKTKSYSRNLFKDVAVEILWKSTAIKNQQYKANISIYFAIRAIDYSQDTITNTIKDVYGLIKNTINSQKYNLKKVAVDEYTEIINSICDERIIAIVKDEKIENLQNQLMPYCYSFDRIPVTNNDMSSIVDVLLEHPNCAISIQLIPTQLKDYEIVELDRLTQVLGTLSKGVLEQGVGNISFSVAEKYADIYHYYSNNKYSAFYEYNILVFGNSESTTNIASKIYGQISAEKDSSVNMKMIALSNGEVNKNANLYPLPWAAAEVLKNKYRSKKIWASGKVSDRLYRMPYIFTSEEACELFRLPIGSSAVSAGLVINESAKTAKTYADNIINGGDIEVGKLRSSSKGDTIGFNLKDLAKHMLVVGTPGSGKTTFSVGMLDRLWKEHHIPFLVIEPAKNEYRALVQSIPDLQVFTPGKNFISPFVYNPFVPPKNVKLETYKSTLKTAFAAGVSMTTPLDKIFEEAINNCYSDFRWLDTYTTDNKGKIFNITDFIKCFQQTFDEIGYTGDAKNIGRAGVVRLNSLVNLFDNYYSIPIEDLLSKPTIIELAAIENAEQKSLIIALLLLSILSYVNANYIGEGGLKNVILLEEAHVLLDSNSSSVQGEANPSSIAQGLIKRMLAEIRSYGVGLVIADQSPRKVGTDVVALTDMKVIFRLVEAADKQIIADSSNMSDAMIQRMSKLKPGEAFLFFNKLDEPEEVITPDYRLENNISISLSDDGIKSLSTYWKNKPEMLKPYPECDEINYCKQTCDYNQRVLAREVARRIYVKNFKPDSTDFELVKKVFSKISLLIKYELNDEPFTPELLSCVKVHLWRRIKYSTKIKINEKLIENSLKK